MLVEIEYSIVWDISRARNSGITSRTGIADS